MKKAMSKIPSAAHLRAACCEAADDPSLLFFEGFDQALIGYAERDGEPVAAYSAEKMVALLRAQGWTELDAWSHLSSNVLGAWMGEKTPIVVLPADA